MDTGQHTYYLLFPWADGNLIQVFKHFNDKQSRLGRCVWMAEQCYELAKAVRLVHNEREVHLRLIMEDDRESEQKHELYGRHGDIKAENVLWYKKQNMLVLSDFGLGRLNTKYSRSKADPRHLDKTMTYRAPEFDTRGGRISRKSDVFSLGCLCLEFMTWYMEGYEAVVTDFPDFRQEPDVWNFMSDSFFRVEDFEQPSERAVIKPRVTEWIDRLRHGEHGSEYIDQFLNLVKRMLEPDVKKRPDARSAENELRTLRDACRQNSSFYTKRELSAPDVRTRLKFRT